jgi:phage shock protein C
MPIPLGGNSQHLVGGHDERRALDGPFPTNHLKKLNFSFLARVMLRSLACRRESARRTKELLEMQTAQPALPFRDDNLLGICQAIGDDFGFNPLWLRLVFASALIWNPMIDIGAYLALGLVVMLTRLIVPNPRPARAVKQADAPAADNSDQPLAVAA